KRARSAPPATRTPPRDRAGRPRSPGTASGARCGYWPCVPSSGMMRGGREWNLGYLPGDRGRQRLLAADALPDGVEVLPALGRLVPLQQLDRPRVVEEPDDLVPRLADEARLLLIDLGLAVALGPELDGLPDRLGLGGGQPQRPERGPGGVGGARPHGGVEADVRVVVVEELGSEGRLG